MPTYSLPELAKLADVTPRTIRFYIAQGLIPQPELQGPNTRYTDEHLARLLAIKRLQGAHLPLAEIRQQLRAMPAEQVTRVADTPPSAASGAVDYIQNLLATRPSASHQAAPPPLPSMAPPASGPAPQREPTQTRSQWERIPLDPDIELHVRRPLTRQHNKRVERLIAIARELFEED